MGLFCGATECVWLVHSTKCFCASSARERRSCRSASPSKATMKVSDLSASTCPVKSSPGRLRERWRPHVPLMFVPVRVSSSDQSLLLWQHLHNHPGLGGCLRQGVNRGPGREAGLSGGPAAGQPRLGRRWDTWTLSWTQTFYEPASGWCSEKLDPTCWESDGSGELPNHTLVATGGDASYFSDQKQLQLLLD